MKRYGRFLTFCLLLTAILMFFAAPAGADDEEYVKWLKDQSMLQQGDDLAKKYMGNGEQWLHPYAMPQPEKLCETASVWYTAYPASTITAPGKTILQTMGDPDLWKAFKEIGIQAMHTGPLRRAGGIVPGKKEYTPTVDGGFDRISLHVDPRYGDDAQYQQMVATAKKNLAVIAGDIIPGHTGKGADFRLAERNCGDYPGIFHMVEIDKKDWGLLPEVPEGRDSINIMSLDLVHKLKEKGYIVGRLIRVIFYEKGVKETNWSVTPVVKGVDGQDRRWVFLHYFKEGQPTLNWLDPTFAANRLIAGDILMSTQVLGARIIRLDANGFLGVERKPGEVKAWSEGHPLSINACNTIAMMARKFGGFTFQELNLTIEDIKEFAKMGADLSYDFITRPAYIHAVITGDGEFLRLMLHKMHEHKINPMSLIHALQNHDEITYELVHFYSHPDRKFKYHGKEISGEELRNMIIAKAKGAVTGRNAPYNLLSGNGLCTTLTGVCAAVLKVHNPYKMKPDELERVKKAHLLMAMFNAMQPGVFALSGWDLVGALPLPAKLVKERLTDGDNRWVNRGAYDLMNVNPRAEKSSSDLPKAIALYGPLPEQLKDKNSFASRLKNMLQVRSKYKIQLSEQIAVPDVKNKGLVLMVHRLPDNMGIEVTALNFGRSPVKETVEIPEIAGKEALSLLDGKKDGKADGKGAFEFNIPQLEGKAILFK